MNWSHIMIHHSLTKDSETVSWSAIRDYHVNTNHWMDIGYHFGVEWAGFGYEALVGRPLDIFGAHCKEGGMNHKAIGICVVGNYDLVVPPSKALEVLCKRLIMPLARVYKIPITKERIVFHREFATYKSCPGVYFNKESLSPYIAWED